MILIGALVFLLGLKVDWCVPILVQHHSNTIMSLHSFKETTSCAICIANVLKA